LNADEIAGRNFSVAWLNEPIDADILGELAE
jgi:hypothetical protein